MSSAISVLPALSSSSATPARSDVYDERVPQTIGFSKEDHAALKSVQPSLGSQPLASLTASASSKPEQPSDATTIPAILSSASGAKPVSSAISVLSALSSSSAIPTRSDVSDERVPQTIGFSKENHLALKSAQPSLGSQPLASLTASASSKPEQPSDATTIPSISSSGPQVR